LALSRSFELRENRFPISNEDGVKGISYLASQLANRPNIIYSRAYQSRGQSTQDTVRAVLNRLGGDSSALFIPPMDESSLSAVLMELLKTKGNLYPVLRKHRLQVIRPVTFKGDDILLAGGSYSTTTLCVKHDKFVVQKKIKITKDLSNIDVDLRLRNERAWLGALPDVAARLFPPVTRWIETDTEFGYEMEFIPWSTAGELVFQECINGEQLFKLLHQIYSLLATNLYSRPSIRMDTSSSDETYLDRIERRAQTILKSDYPQDGILRTLFTAQHVIVNGIQCPSLFDLLQRLRSDKNWSAIIRPQDNRLCHGDLVLENVLVGGSNDEFRLVDPNPANNSVIFDIAKTLLSLWVGYEFLYYDLFAVQECIVKTGGQELYFTCTLERPECQHEYAVAAERFIEFVEKELLPSLGLHIANVRSTLGVICGLLALAIPMFHLLHHERESRALTLACLGLRQAAMSLR
jgi:hypothetical protein